MWPFIFKILNERFYSIMSFKTLKINKEFLRVYGRGKSYVDPCIVVYILNNRQNDVRIGITTGKKLGCAVNRNRARRLIMAAWRNCYSEIIDKNKDIIFVARTRILKCTSYDVERALRRIFIKHGLIKNDEKTAYTLN